MKNQEKINQKNSRGNLTSNNQPLGSRGITLVALVITVIVLIILAGITIKLVL